MAHNTDKEDNHFEDELETDTLEDVYVYMTRKQYREGLTQNQKRIVRRKAANFCVVDGELVFRKKHKGKDEVQQVRYIRERKEQLSIVQACHGDQTSGHLGYRKTLARITERFMWITQARIDIGVTLLSYSVDMTERCIMCGAGEQSISHPQYVDWVRCDKCKQWSHIICTNLKPEEAKNVKTFSCHECSQDIHQINDFE
ncbi:uncharacterized protein [Dysidea avara]|uniref:uncharacterized protein n=1 Tax=Dysidea avara TaxID=196820 RepID=UPI00331B5A17